MVWCGAVLVVALCHVAAVDAVGAVGAVVPVPQVYVAAPYAVEVSRFAAASGVVESPKYPIARLPVPVFDKRNVLTVGPANATRHRFA
jgi:hypothetical protein